MFFFTLNVARKSVRFCSSLPPCCEYRYEETSNSVGVPSMGIRTDRYASPLLSMALTMQLPSSRYMSMSWVTLGRPQIVRPLIVFSFEVTGMPAI